jgi:hypothetical protein
MIKVNAIEILNNTLKENEIFLTFFIILKALF